MRLALLQLLAFGPFTGLELDFSAPKDGLHVLYGPNEAGKSTALRAVTGLLYGIPAKTTDAHLHAMQDLRIGARLEGREGESLTIVRRKGLRNTLADPAGNAVDEMALRRLLGGVGEELFRTMFGLDHETLRQGAQALLEGKGDVGESLFGAAVGGSGLHQIRKELREEADALFTPQAHKKPLNEALRVFADAQKRSRLEPTSAETWQKQKRAVEEAIEESKRLDQEARALREQRHRLQRAARALPLLGRQRELEARRAALGEVVILPGAAGPERVARQREATQARAQAERLEREIAALEQEQAALSASVGTPGGHDDALDALPNRLGIHDKAASDLPRVLGEADQLEEAVRSIVRRLGPNASVPIEDLERLRVDAATQARIRKLAAEPAVLEQRLAQAEADLAARRARKATEQERLADLAPQRAPGDLAAVLARVQREGDLDERIRAAEPALRRLEASALAARKALGLGERSMEEAATLSVPSLDAVERLEKRLTRLAKDEDTLAERERAAAARGAEIDRELGALELEGSVPTERELGEARARRDEHWKGLRGATKRMDAAAADAFEQRLRESDDIADRLRREAERVSRRARLIADRESASAERGRLEEERSRLTARRDELDLEWRAAWAASGVDPQPPAEMRGWLGRHAALAPQAAEIADGRRELQSIRDRASELARELRAALGPDPDPTASLGALVATAQRAVTAAELATRRREELERSQAELAQDIARLGEDVAQHRRALDTWQTAWGTSVAALGLGATAAPEEATAVLAELGELFPKLEELRRVKKRIAGIERDATHFAADVGRLVAATAPDLSAMPARDAAAELGRRAQRARVDRAKLDQIERQLADKRSALAEQHDRLRAAEAGLAELLAAARAPDLDALERAERLSAEAEEIDGELREVGRSLRAAAEGGAVETLAAEIGDQSADALAVELERLDATIDEAEQRHAIEQRGIGQKEAGLRDLETKSVAADAATEAQEALARVRTHVDRYVRIRLAGAVLAREIERYREANQGPILGRASTLFRGLTLDHYSALRAGWNEQDEAVLRCVRKDGREVGVEALSDGTRDQLYLALRLASLERFTEGNESMPLVVDDILIHFDDDRARAALSALADLAGRTQIFFFTHHARLMELAREAVPADRLKEHRLG